jgi:hypothetical protein
MSLKNKEENKQEFILPTQREGYTQDGFTKPQADNNTISPLKNQLQVKTGDAAVLETSQDNQNFNELYDKTGNVMQGMDASTLFFRMNTSLNFKEEVGKMMDSSMMKMSPFMLHTLGALYSKGDKTEKEMEAKEAVIAAWERRNDDIEEKQEKKDETLWSKIKDAMEPITREVAREWYNEAVELTQTTDAFKDSNIKQQSQQTTDAVSAAAKKQFSLTPPTS